MKFEQTTIVGGLVVIASIAAILFRFPVETVPAVILALGAGIIVSPTVASFKFSKDGVEIINKVKDATSNIPEKFKEHDKAITNLNESIRLVNETLKQLQQKNEEIATNLPKDGSADWYKAISDTAIYLAPTAVKIGELLIANNTISSIGSSVTTKIEDKITALNQ